MTDIFRNLNDKMASEYTPIAPMAETSQVQAVCLYQIAVSMNEIDKTLKNILAEMKKRKV